MVVFRGPVSFGWLGLGFCFGFSLVNRFSLYLFACSDTIDADRATGPTKNVSVVCVVLLRLTAAFRRLLRSLLVLPLPLLACLRTLYLPENPTLVRRGRTRPRGCFDIFWSRRVHDEPIRPAWRTTGRFCSTRKKNSRSCLPTRCVL